MVKPMKPKNQESISNSICIRSILLYPPLIPPTCKKVLVRIN